MTTRAGVVEGSARPARTRAGVRGNDGFMLFLIVASLVALAALPLHGVDLQRWTAFVHAGDRMDATPASEPAAVLNAPHSKPGALSTRPVPLGRVADAVSKRYRVSSVAVSQIVEAAYKVGQRVGIDPLLIIAVVAVESRFNPIAESEMGAVGLMQVVPRFHADKVDGAPETAFTDPRTNIEVGARILKEYITRGGNEADGLQMYNGSLDDPSKAYANKVIGERDRLRQLVVRATVSRAD